MSHKAPPTRRAPRSPALFLLTLVAVAALTLAAALAPRSALGADLIAATQAYEKGDYPTAFKDFHDLAELGQPTAQFNLAVMYARGQGTRESKIYAYAWASLAAQNGIERGTALMNEMRPSLALAPGSEQIAADIEAQYGRAVLDQRLFPKIATSESSDMNDRARCSPLNAYIPAYPLEAQDRGVQGGVFAEFSLMPDGHSRNPRIIYAIPSEVFEPAVRESLLHTQFAEGAPGSKPVLCTIFYRFVVAGASRNDYPQLNAFVSDTLKRAQSGDPSAQMLYGMLLVGLPQLNRPRREAMPWFLKSAQAGSPTAQFTVGFSLLRGWGCDCEENKGLDWLRRAAQSGQPDAEVTLAMYALKGTPDEGRQRQAKSWLEEAAGSGNHDGKLYLAALLAAAPDQTTRDPQRAQKLLDEVFRGVNDDPTAFEIRAAAQASAGQFKDAARSETKAINMAQRLKWDVTALNDRLAHYSANQPWYGTLLEF